MKEGKKKKLEVYKDKRKIDRKKKKLVMYKDKRKKERMKRRDQ